MLSTLEGEDAERTHLLVHKHSTNSHHELHNKD
jgi:hypothetical protein